MPISSGTITAGDDIIVGTSGADTIDALAGNDSIDGLEGNDILSGNTGDDTLTGGTGTNTLNGGANNDTINSVTAGGNTLSIDWSDKTEALFMSAGDSRDLTVISADRIINGFGTTGLAHLVFKAGSGDHKARSSSTTRRLASRSAMT